MKQEETIISATYDESQLENASALVAKAIKEVNRGAPGYPKQHAQQKARSDRFHNAFREHAILIASVAQWLSAKSNQSAAANARIASERIMQIAKDIQQLHEQFGETAKALSFEQTTTQGHEIAGCAEVLSASLRDALGPFQLTTEVAQQMLMLLPRNAKGSSGIVGALRYAPPDTALAVALAEIWHFKGLTLNGGYKGDGLDIFLGSLLGPQGAESALTAAKKVLVKKKTPNAIG